MRSCEVWLRLSLSFRPVVREVSAPSMPRMSLATTRKRLPKPSRLASVRLELENSAFSSDRLAIALSKDPVLRRLWRRVWSIPRFIAIR